MPPAYYPAAQVIMIVLAIVTLGVAAIKIARNQHQWRAWLPAVLVVIHTLLYYTALLVAYPQMGQVMREEWSLVLRIHTLVTLLVYALAMPLGRTQL